MFLLMKIRKLLYDENIVSREGKIYFHKKINCKKYDISNGENVECELKSFKI